MRIRLIIGLTCVFSIFLITQLSPKNEVLSPALKAQSELSSQPDFDFQSLSERLWDEGNQAGAVAAINTAQRLKLGKEDSLKERLLFYRSETLVEQTELSKLKFTGLNLDIKKKEEGNLALLSQKGNLWETLKLTGDSLVLEPNKLGSLLFKLKEVADVYPKAMEQFNVLKSLVQSGALNDTLTSQLLETLSPLARLKKTSSNFAKISTTKNTIDRLASLNQLVKEATNWYQIKLFLDQCRTMDQVSQLVKIVTPADNVIKTEQLLTVLDKRQKNIQDTISYVKLYGQRGLDNIHSAIRKGPKGIQFVLAHPNMPLNLNQVAETNKDDVLSPLRDNLKKLKMSYGNIYEIGKNYLIALLLFITIVSWIPKKLLVQSENIKVNEYINKNYLFIVGTACTVIFVILVANHFLSVPETVQAPTLSTISAPTVQGAVQTKAAVSQAVETAAKQKSVLSPISWATVIIFLIIHTFVASNTKSKITGLAKRSMDAETKLGLLGNVEHDLDLSVYIGLAGTVTSFIIMQFDPSGSRILAYSSTLVGIIISCWLKTAYYQPLRNTLMGDTSASLKIFKDKEGEYSE